MRRSGELERLMYQKEHDGLRGRMTALSKRREQQKRGPSHSHYNEYAEPCRKRRRLFVVPMVHDGSKPYISIVGGGISTNLEDCRADDVRIPALEDTIKEVKPCIRFSQKGAPTPSTSITTHRPKVRCELLQRYRQIKPTILPSRPSSRLLQSITRGSMMHHDIS